MKTNTIVVCAALALAAAAGCVAENAPAKLRPEPCKKLLDERWTGGAGAWSFTNHMNLLTFGVVQSEGGPVYRIENKQDKSKGRKVSDTLFILSSDFIPVEPGADFAVISEARGDVQFLSSIHYRKEKSGYRVKLPATAVVWYDADKKPVLIQDPMGYMIASCTDLALRTANEDFVRSVFREKVPESAHFAKVQIGGDAPDIGPGSWVEFRRLTFLQREGANGDWDFGDLDAPRYERLSKSPDPDANAVFRFKVSDASALDMNAFSCALDGVDVTAKVRNEGDGVFSYAPETPWKPNTLYRMMVDAADVVGNVSTETLAFYCGEPSKAKKVTVRDDGMILIDGKAFFPIGASSMRPSPAVHGGPYEYEKMLKQVTENGFNCGGMPMLHDFAKPNDMKMVDRYLDLCEKYGFRVWAETASRSYGTEKRVGEMVKTRQYSRNRDAILMWCLADDTASHTGPLAVKNDHNIVKAIDDSHITEQPDICTYAGRYAPFAESTDSLRLELYPFREAVAEPHGLAQLVRDINYAYGDLRRSGAKNRSIIAIPQAFSGWGLWKRFPTHREIRTQAYLSAIYGCRGVTYYSFFSYTKGSNGFASNAEQLETVFKVTRELASLHDDLAARDAKVQPKVEVVKGAKKDLMGFNSVAALLKADETGKGALLMAATSRNDQELKATISGLDATKAVVISENREVPVVGGVLTDTFAPGDSHVYRLVK